MDTHTIDKHPGSAKLYLYYLFSNPYRYLQKKFVMFRKLARRATMTPYEATQYYDFNVNDMNSEYYFFD